jgi:hypothetical protein
LASLDYYLLPNLRKYLKGQKISSTEAILAVDGHSAAQPKDFLLYGLKLEQQDHKCVELGEEHAKEIYFF